MARLCGYCRKDGHRADKCDEKAKIRMEILTHTPRERKFTLETMVKNGFGEGATFAYTRGYDNVTTTNVITDPSFIRNWQFSSISKVRYSKQIRFTPLQSICRDEAGNIIDNRHQWDYLNINCLSFGEGTSKEETLRLAIRYILNPAHYDASTANLTSIPLLIEPSYKMFDVPDHLYVDNVTIHKRVASENAILTDRWSDTYAERGILPR